MNPESPLFRLYDEQLGGEIAEAAFNQNLNVAVDELTHLPVNDERIMVDAQRLASAVRDSQVVLRHDISESIYRSNERTNTTTVAMSPPYDQFEREGVACASYVGALHAAPHGSRQHVLRIVVATEGQRTLPDLRGVYVARGANDQTVTMLQVEQCTTVGGEVSVQIAEITEKADRQAVLEELQKAAAAAREHRRTTAGRSGSR